MGKVHFGYENDPDEYYVEKARCGTPVGEGYKISSYWHEVTCKKCLKNRSNIESSVKCEEDYIINQMGDMVEHFKTQQ